MQDNTRQTDILIIGSGISALICALEISSNYHVTILTKSRITTGATLLAQGGIAAVDPKTGDSFKSHENDTLTAGSHHNKIPIVKEVVRLAPNIITLLETYGTRFDEGYALEGGHGHYRIHHTKDTTGATIERALVKAVKKRPNIDVEERAIVIDLIMDKGICRGSWYLKDDTIYNITSAHTVIATGGIGQTYLHTTNPIVATGDGIAMAHRAGARVQDMEFVQFHPTALLDTKNPHFLLSEALRGEGAVLRNAKSEPFMQRYHPLAELAPRDKVSQAIFCEQQHGSIYLDISHKPKKWIRERFPAIYAAVQERLSLDLSKNQIPITPAAHYLCGGISVNADGKTSVPLLYAIGEAAYTGLHGANRLASNSLLEGAVFGAKVANSINSIPRNQRTQKPIKTTSQYAIAAQPFKMKKVRQKIKEIMWNHVGIQRTKLGLEKAIFELDRLKSIMPPSHIINKEILETRNLIEVGTLIAKAAKKRQKSLGCHWIQPQIR